MFQVLENFNYRVETEIPAQISDLWKFINSVKGLETICLPSKVVGKKTFLSQLRRIKKKEYPLRLFNCRLSLRMTGDVIYTNYLTQETPSWEFNYIGPYC